MTPSSFSTSGLALVISDDFSSAGVNSGWSCVSSAAAPATCGEAIEVPLIDWNSSPGLRPELTAGSGAAAARMFTPGAVTSGFGMSGTAVCGPRDENAARMPPRGRPFALPAVSSASAPGAIRAFTCVPSVNDTCTLGTQWVSVTSSCASEAL